MSLYETRGPLYQLWLISQIHVPSSRNLPLDTHPRENHNGQQTPHACRKYISQVVVNTIKNSSKPNSTRPNYQNWSLLTQPSHTVTKPIVLPQTTGKGSTHQKNRFFLLPYWSNLVPDSHITPSSFWIAFKLTLLLTSTLWSLSKPHHKIS